MFLCFINYSTLTTDQGIQATLMQNLFENVHTVREEKATWSGRLPCAFFQSLPAISVEIQNPANHIIEVILTWQEIITFTDKQTCMHACSYSDTVISEKSKTTKIFIQP